LSEVFLWKWSPISDELARVAAQFVAHGTERREAIRLGALRGDGVFEILVQPDRWAEQHRTALAALSRTVMT